jgi:hypothetical protein
MNEMQRSHSQEVFHLKDRIAKLEDFIQERFLIDTESKPLASSAQVKEAGGDLNQAFQEFLSGKSKMSEDSKNL